MPLTRHPSCFLYFLLLTLAIDSPDGNHDELLQLVDFCYISFFLFYLTTVEIYRLQ
jgi:hypothetical protein